MNENRRVAVTGLGRISSFDTSKMRATLAAEVKDFHPEQYMEVNETLRTDRFPQFAVAAAQQAVEGSGIEGKVDPKRFSVRFGTGIGGISTFEKEYSKLMEHGPRRVSPLFVPMMANMAAGHMMGAAAAVEALACILALREGVIPPTIHLEVQDDCCDFSCVPNQAVRADITLALSNSLGFGGHNACLAFRKV